MRPGTAARHPKTIALSRSVEDIRPLALGKRQHFFLGLRDGDIEIEVIDGQRRYGNGLLLPSVTLSDDDLRRVEQDFWQISPRARVRKVAVLLRFRSFLAACQSRHVSELIARHGQQALVTALEAAAHMRLNAKWGFNPHKMARTMSEALAAAAEGYRVEGRAVPA